MAKMQWLLLATCLLHAVSLAYSFTYLGCFVDNGHRDLPALRIRGHVTVARCNNQCSSENFKYFGLQNSNECWCGNSYGKYGGRSSHECNRRCTGDRNAYCGAGWRNSVYRTELTIGMRSVGCFRDAPTRDLPVLAHRGTVRIGMCYQMCRQRGFPYFGLQNGNECWCGKDYGKHGARPAHECNKRCSGDTSTYCGAGWRNSVYTTGLNPAKAIFGSHVDTATLKGQLLAALKTQFRSMPNGVMCSHCLISAWQKRHVNVNRNVFPVSHLDSFSSTYSAAVRAKLQVLKFGAHAKTTFYDFHIDIRRQLAVRKSLIGIARRVGGNVEVLALSGELVATVVRKLTAHVARVCKKILWIRRCHNKLVYVDRGLHAHEIHSITQAMESETIQMFIDKSHLWAK